MLPDEIARMPVPASERAPRVTAHVLGLDGIGIIVGSAIEARALTTLQIARIFAGLVTDWSEVGLAHGPVKLYAPDDGQAAREVFARVILAPHKLALSAAATTSNDSAVIARAVAQDPYGIGFASLSAAGEARLIDIATPCGLVSKPTPFALRSEEYALSRRLFLYSGSAALDPAAQALVDFAAAPAGQAIVADHGFVDQAIVRAPFAAEAARVRAPLRAGASRVEATARDQLATDLAPRHRLSTTIRFGFSTSTVDPRARADLERLVASLKTPASWPSGVLLAGYSDSTGTPGPNLALSQRRAEQVRAIVLALAEGAIRPEEVVARGYGPVGPVACNDIADGQHLNRRVEVWVRE